MRLKRSMYMNIENSTPSYSVGLKATRRVAEVLQVFRWVDLSHAPSLIQDTQEIRIPPTDMTVLGKY